MRRNRKSPEENVDRMRELGGDILFEPRIQGLRAYVQHGSVSRYAHCLSVACIALRLADALGTKVDARSMVRGALLHDFFDYDWHDPSAHERWHGLRHARIALDTAKTAFELNPIECDVILRHMFPLNLRPPKTREAALVSLADKISAVGEALHLPFSRRLAALCEQVRPVEA